MPYVARPSWLNGGPDQAEVKPSSSVGASPTPGAASPVPVGAAPIQGALPGVQGTGFVNLNQYLQEGRGQAASFAQKNIVDPMNVQAQQVGKEASTFADQNAYWKQQADARAAAEKGNEGKDPTKPNPAHDEWQRKLDLVKEPGGPKESDWLKSNPEPSATLSNLGNLPAVPVQPTPPAGLTGRSSAVNADRRVSQTMAGRANLFGRAAGQGYGYGNFDAYLSGGKPWAGVQGQYPTLWQQIKGNPANRQATAGMPQDKEPVYYGNNGQPATAPAAPQRPGERRVRR